MKNESFEITAIRFFEHPVVDISQAEPSHYDVTAIGLKYPISFIANNGFLMNAYCEALLLKIIGLDKTEIVSFLDYQCGLVKEPAVWLDKFEILIDQNLCYFDDPIQKLKVNKLYINIQFCRANLTNKHKLLSNLHVNWEQVLAPEHSVKFDFCQVKHDLEKLDSLTAQKVYLIKLKADYLQTKRVYPLFINESFGTLIDIEMETIDKLIDLPSLPSHPTKENAKNGSKIRINGNANVLIDIFYRLLYEYKVDGKPFIDNTPTEVARMIVDTYIRKDGKDLSLNTVQTTLSPGKVDKRPSCDKRFCMHKILNSTFLIANLYIIDHLNYIAKFALFN